jgi:hypothetical protein
MPYSGIRCYRVVRSFTRFYRLLTVYSFHLIVLRRRMNYEAMDSAVRCSRVIGIPVTVLHGALLCAAQQYSCVGPHLSDMNGPVCIRCSLMWCEYTASRTATLNV